MTGHISQAIGRRATSARHQSTAIVGRQSQVSLSQRVIARTTFCPTLRLPFTRCPRRPRRRSSAWGLTLTLTLTLIPNPNPNPNP
eukprot:scaffold81163_cov48-Phaeocystis_antarctica.AAC.3